jgi:aspartokinase/homoserine dehydrogenase 1
MEKILKFGGTSCGSVESIESVLAIIEANHQLNSKFAVVFSAMSGVTNALLEAGAAAAGKQKSDHTLIEQIENRHFEIIKHFIPVTGQSQVIAQIRTLVNELRDVLKGIDLIKEISPKTSDLLVSFGERLSTALITAILTQRGIPVVYVDARNLIKTNAQFGKAEVNFEKTRDLIQAYFKESDTQIALITGFIASNELGETTTLGRGGSDIQPLF